MKKKKNQENGRKTNSPKSKSIRNREFAVTTYIFLGLFVGMMGYFVYFMQFQSNTFINSPFNRRQDVFAEHVIRGNILSADGKVLAETVVSSDGSETRRYPYSNMFAHAVGFDVNGKSGMELFGNFDLLRSHAFFVEQIINGVTNQKNPGDNIVSTLNYDLQEVAFHALGSNRGAVIVMEPRTGKILTWISKPDFNPNSVAENWDAIRVDEERAPLLNRVSQGMYPPGSTFKTLTSLQYLRQHNNDMAYSYECTGRIDVGGAEIRCFNGAVHGHVDLTSAFAKSCNTGFSNMGLEMNLNQFSGLSNDMLFATDIPVDYPTSRSQFVLGSDASPFQIAQTSIGQGETLMSPLHVNLITCAIANHGRVMRPYVIDRTENYNGVTVSQNRSSSYTNLLSPEEVDILQGLMEAVVASGTATALQSSSYNAAGKTGSAEFIRGQSHAWFTGYAGSEGKETVAVTIIVENGGTGGGVAVPIAKRIFDTYFR